MAKENTTLWQAIKFTLFSFSAGIVQAASFALFYEVFGWTAYWASHIPSLVLSVIWNFTFNRKYTFHSDVNIPRSMLLIGLFYLVFTPASAWWGTALQNVGWHAWLVELLNMAINLVTEYFYQRFVVFRGHINTAAKG